jgi:hypothetical protein
LFLVCDEALYAGDKEAQGIFKALVTEDRMVIEQKFHDSMEVTNSLSMVFCSNNVLKAVPVGEGDRRSTIIQVSGHHKNDRAYFDGLKEALDDGERAAFLDAMLKRDLSAYNRRVPFTTDAKLEAVRANAGPTATWWIEHVESGQLPGLEESIRLMGLKEGQPGTDWDKEPVVVLTDPMWSDFQSWQQHQRIYPEKQIEWGKTLEHICPDRNKTHPWVQGGGEDPIAERKRRAWGYTYPPRSRCLEMIRKLYGGDAKEVE